MPFYKQSLDLK